MTIDRAAMLRDKLAGTRHAPRIEAIERILQAKESIRVGLPVEVERASDKKAPNGEAYHIKIKASTEAVARDAGIIPIEAWSRGGLKNFNANPVVLAFHDSRDLPVAKSVFNELDSSALIEYWRFHEETELSKVMRKLYEDGYMRAASVGFLVHEFKFTDELSEKEAEEFVEKYGAAALKDAYWIAKRAELLETSAVPVPSDPNALSVVDKAFRSAGAVGIDLSPVFKHLPTDFGTVRNQMPEPIKTPDTPAIETVSRAEFDKVAAELKELRDAVAGLTTRLAEVEKPVAEPERQVEIEVKEGETNEQAVARTIDELIAKKRGAPAPKK